MRKNILLIISIILTAAVLISCGGEADVTDVPDSPPDDIPAPVTGNDPDPTPTPANENNGNNNGDTDNTPVEPPDFFFKIGDVIINLDENISYVIDKLGEPIGIQVLPSCAFDGDDRIYRYPGADLYTYPSGDKDFIHTIVFFDDTVRTAEGGVRLGSRLQTVLDAYGEDYQLESGMYTFTRGDTLLEFLIEDNEVIGIQYRLDIEIQIG